MQELYKEMQDAVDDLNIAYSEVDLDQPTSDDLLRLDAHMSNLFATIRAEGICRADIDKMNELGLTDIESKYFSIDRSTIGLESAAGLEITSGFVGTVVSGVLVAVIAAQAFIVYKLYKFIMGIIEKIRGPKMDRMKDASTLSDMNIAASKVDFPDKANRSLGALKAILALPDGGDEILTITRTLEDCTKVFLDILRDLSDSSKLSSEIEKLIGSSPTATAKDIRDILDKVPASPLEAKTARVNDYLVKMMGETLSKDRRDNVSDFTALVEYRGSQIFSDKLLSDSARREFILDASTYDTEAIAVILDSSKKSIPNLEKYQAKLSKGMSIDELQRKGLGSVKTSKRNIEAIIKGYINRQVVDSANYLRFLSSRVIPTFISGLASAQSAQVEVSTYAYRAFSNHSQKWVVSTVGKTGLPKVEQEKLLNQWNKVFSSGLVDGIKLSVELLATMTSNSNIDAEVRSDIMKSSLSKTIITLSSPNGIKTASGLVVHLL